MVNLAAGPHLQPMYQIRCKYMQKWPTYGQKCDFQYGGRRHLGFLAYVNFDGKSGCRTPFTTYVSNLVQIYAKMADLWDTSVIFNMAAATILDFAGYQFCC